VIIHVPFHVKNIEHTHIIYKIIKHNGNSNSVYGDRKKMTTSDTFNELHENFYN
jgi:hypothetical protein